MLGPVTFAVAAEVEVDGLSRAGTGAAAVAAAAGVLAIWRGSGDALIVTLRPKSRVATAQPTSHAYRGGAVHPHSELCRVIAVLVVVGSGPAGRACRSVWPLAL